VECTHQGNLKRAAQNMKAEALGDRAKSEAELDRREEWDAREAGVWVRLVSLQGSRSGARQHSYDDRSAGRHGAVAWLPDKPGSGGFGS